MDAEERGLNVITPGAMVVVPLAETLAINGAGETPFTAARLWLNAVAPDISVAVIRTNRGDGSTDTVTYPVQTAVRPEDRQ